MYIEYDKRSCSSFINYFLVSLFIYGFIFLRVGAGIFIFLNGVVLPPKKIQFFIKIGETPPVSKGDVYTGRPYTRTDYRIFKKTSLFNKRKVKTWN